MSRPNNAPAYYLGRPASLWLSLGRRRRLRTLTIPVPPRRPRTITISVPQPLRPLDDRVRVDPGGRPAPG